MKRFKLSKDDNAWSGLVNSWMSENPNGQYVLHDDVVDLQNRMELLDALAIEAGFEDIESLLANQLEVNKLEHTGD